MNFNKPMRLLLLSSLLLASGCATQSTVQQPPVQVVNTCPAPQPTPAELRTKPQPDLSKRADALLTEFFNSLPKPTKP